MGRDSEQAAIAALLDAARASRSGSLVIHGEAGIGKSALLEDARERAEGMRILKARGVEAESDLPFAGLHQLLRPALYLLDALPVPQAEALRGALGLSERTGDDRFLISVASLTLLSELAEQGPVLCLVDDVQWLDGPSADALLFVARRLDAEGIVILFATRDTDGRGFDERDVDVMSLLELDRTASEALLTARVGFEVAPAVCRALVEQAAGNALALVDLPTGLTESQLAGSEPLPNDLRVTWSLTDLYLDQVRQLPEDAQRLVLIAAADDSGLLTPVTRAAGILGLAPYAIDSVEGAGLVRIDGARLEFRHPLVRSAAYHAASAPERRVVHRVIAEALSETADADRRAWHLATAATGPDEEVADALEVTADRARRRSGPAAAATALERASDLSTDSSSRARRLVRAAEAAWHAGQPERASLLISRAAPEVIDPQLAIELDHLRGTIAFWCGDLLQAAEILAGSVARGPSVDVSRSLEMLVDAAEAAAWANDFGRVGQISELAASLPRTDSEEAVLADLLMSVTGLFSGMSADELPQIAAVLASSHGLANPRWLVWAAAAAGAMGDQAQEIALLRQAASSARTSGAVDTLAHVLVTVAARSVFEGRVGVVIDATEGLTLAREARLPNAASIHLAVLAWFAGVRGEDELCLARAAEVSESATVNRNGFASAIANWGIALLELGRGRGEEAIVRLRAVSQGRAGEGHAYVALASAADFVEAAVRCGRGEDAEAVYAGLAAFAQPRAPAWARALSARCRAQLTEEPSEAERQFTEALRLHSESNRPFDLGRTALLYGEFLRRERRRLDAREHLRSALVAFEDLGAEPWIERARTELRASGETARRRDPTTVDTLTPQELQIARLVAEGLSNKEVAAQLFLSPRTIQYHLRHVFAKLDVTSRTQLARLVLTDTVEADVVAMPSAVR